MMGFGYCLYTPCNGYNGVAGKCIVKVLATFIAKHGIPMGSDLVITYICPTMR